ncbi:SAM-dependent methyltransferase [Streptomyces sp. RY43-2]|uniref:SAM-dependent methyltransferase n=1 Tax=Streptomyces macrolidinus TaxID=2952607 RepID=A0ABT0ZBU4_9ACTN|nr:SAM-dependent methyltransferase [Streptomyces macrolidinus]MCN9241238.1 SAM-dependent methyltransferase [Streptomyces macrolidinus]
MPGDALHHDPVEVSGRIDTTKPHPARVYDVLLGGKDHYPVDRQAAAAAFADHPRGHLTARHNRDFLRRAVTTLVRDEGIRQFLDIGAGLPTAENVHQIAQRISPDARVVYVDNDPIVLAHARALLTSSAEGRTDYIDADLKDPARILEVAAKTLDFDQPIALCLVAVLHFIEDEAAYGVVRELLDALPPGSRLVLSHLADDLNPEQSAKVAQSFRKSGLTFVLRSREKVERFFTDNGLTLAEPGVVPVHRWRPDGAAPVLPAPDPERFAALEFVDRLKYHDINDVTDEDISVYAAIGHKP